jgi:hypothetical protein
VTQQKPSLPDVPCDQPHKSEVVGQFEPTGLLASRRQWSDDHYRFTCVATDFTFRTGKLNDTARPSPTSS